MEKIIAEHVGNCALIYIFGNINFVFDTKLLEDEEGHFKFSIEVTWSGGASGSRHVEVLVNDNKNGSFSAGSGVTIQYTVSDWTTSSDWISLRLTVNLKHSILRTNHPVFNKQEFAGARAQVILKSEDAEFKAYIDQIQRLETKLGIKVD